MSRRDQILDWTDEDERAYRSTARAYQPRQARARRFADEIVHVLNGYIPADGEVRRLALDYLRRLSFKTNACIVNVPAALDRLDKPGIEKVLAGMKP